MIQFSLEALLRAGINFAEYLIIINKESSNSKEEQALEDCNTILAVQFIFRFNFELISKFKIVENN